MRGCTMCGYSVRVQYEGAISECTTRVPCESAVN